MIINSSYLLHLATKKGIAKFDNSKRTDGKLLSQAIHAYDKGVKCCPAKATMILYHSPDNIHARTLYAIAKVLDCKMEDLICD